MRPGDHSSLIRVDQARLRIGNELVSYRPDPAIADEDGICIKQGSLEITRYDLADVVNQHGSHWTASRFLSSTASKLSRLVTSP